MLNWLRSFFVPLTVADVLSDFERKVDQLGVIIGAQEQRIQTNTAGINQLQDEINVARLEQEKAARAADRLSAFLED